MYSTVRFTEMVKLGCKVYHSQTNFILFDPHIDAQLVRAKLMEAVLCRGKII